MLHLTPFRIGLVLLSQSLTMMIGAAVGGMSAAQRRRASDVQKAEEP